MEDLITSFFAEDHDRLDTLFRRFQLLKAGAPETAAAVLSRFIHALLRHIDWEEQILFPVFEAGAGAPVGAAEAMRFEHHQIKELLESIRGKHNAAVDSRGDEEMLLNILGEHNWKEEQMLYPAIDHHLTGQQLVEIFDRIKATL
jgi:iron-sulfur cluster repair protein YtfE (RIC family)